MPYRLVVSEKPSVAMAYAKVLGVTNRKDGYLEGGGYLVSWCIGHLVELAPPNIYDEKYVKWSIADLPILPQQWQYLVSASTKKQFGVLKDLMNRPDVDSIVCATDSGRDFFFFFLYGQPLAVGAGHDSGACHDGGAGGCDSRFCAGKVLHGGSGTDQRMHGIQPPHS